MKNKINIKIDNVNIEQVESTCYMEVQIRSDGGQEMKEKQCEGYYDMVHISIMISVSQATNM